jgi:predicted dehydrogenase
VKELVGSGAIGALRFIRGSFTFTLTRPSDIRLTPAMGGGSLWDVGCYPVSYARLIAGAEPDEVFGLQETGATGVDVSFAGQMRFPAEVFAQFDCGFRAPYRVGMEFVGREGTVTVPAPFKPGLNEQITLRRDDQSEAIVIHGQELYSGEVEDMADAVLLGQSPRVSLADSRNNVAALLALLHSAREGKPVALSANRRT